MSYLLMTQEQYDARSEEKYNGRDNKSLDGNLYVTQLQAGVIKLDAHEKLFVAKEDVQAFFQANKENWIEEI